ncbi:glycoside hydrolase family 127 protein [Occallatibacter riparius]|uniref:Glycoside hydrolase family 127 protein n=1 Tax=Occallatibacter riparius TaxID=1002689 RepID=A0A9J7BMT4_9BACT|nr:glycoside hydrolase family 127 protein [Occallatibacter riparius]UWZ83951.1 glycoside hydrolase family 127 protein [Occallatibacter riparius]
MNRRQLLASAAVLPFTTHSFTLRAANPGGVDQLTGRPLYDRYQLTLDRVLRGAQPSYTAEFLLEDLHGTPGRRFTNFSGDLSGRWIGSLATSSAQFGERFPVLDKFVAQAVALQHREGYFGKSFNAANPGDDDMALLWGNGRLLVGLLEYHALNHDPQVLAAARNLGNFLLRIAPQFNSQQMADEFNAAHFASSYICWTQQTEGLAALFVATGDTRYRDLCADIAARIERRPGDHVHGYLCSVRGVLDLYLATKDEKFLNRAIAAWNDVAQSGDLLITGGVPEAWSPKKKRTEGCAECDWLRLNLALHAATGEAKYLDAAEDALFNEFAMNQFSTGDFGHAVLDDFGAPESVQVRAWWCCTLHGLRAFPDVAHHTFRIRDNEVFFDLPLDGSLDTGSISLTSQSSLATDRRIRIKVLHASAPHALNIRKPAWSDSVKVIRNGRPHENSRVENLRAGDQIEASYDMSLRLTSADKVLSTRGRTAFHYGPWLLGASTAMQPEYFNELYPSNVLIAGSATRNSTPATERFTIPLAATTVDAIPAEFPGQKLKLDLRAVAEQTGHEPARWATSFLVRTS